MRIKSFRNLEIWADAKSIAIDIFKMTSSDKFRLDFSFRDQIRKSVISMLIIKKLEILNARIGKFISYLLKKSKTSKLATS